MVAQVQSVVRAMTILTAFDQSAPRMSLAQLSQRVDLPRGTTHRLLETLESLGYISKQDGYYEMTPRSLDIGYSYLASLPLPEIGRQIITRLTEEVDEHSSVGVLDGDSVLIVAATPPRHPIDVSTRVGSRLPIALSATGRALLAQFPVEEIARRCRDAGASEAEAEAAVVACEASWSSGYSRTDGALAEGLVSIAVPVIGADEQTIAAVAVASPKSRYSSTPLHDAVAAQVKAAADELGRAVRHSA